MPPRSVAKRGPEEDDRSPARGAKRPGKSKREQTYDTYEDAMDGTYPLTETRTSRNDWE